MVLCVSYVYVRCMLVGLHFTSIICMELNINGKIYLTVSPSIFLSLMPPHTTLFLHQKHFSLFPGIFSEEWWQSKIKLHQRKTKPSFNPQHGSTATVKVNVIMVTITIIKLTIVIIIVMIITMLLNSDRQ